MTNRTSENVRKVQDLGRGDYACGPNLTTGVLKSRDTSLSVFGEKDLTAKEGG